MAEFEYDTDEALAQLPPQLLDTVRDVLTEKIITAISDQAGKHVLRFIKLGKVVEELGLSDDARRKFGTAGGTKLVPRKVEAAMLNYLLDAIFKEAGVPRDGVEVDEDDD